MRLYRLLPPLGVACGLIAAFVLRSRPPRTVIHQGPTIVIDTDADHSHNPAYNRPTIEMAFVLDTTGSMTGLIDAAKQKIWCIINSVMKSPVHPRLKVGLVAYRDHGDVYITKVLQMTDDLDKVYSALMQYRAEGGGDRPEDVRQAMSDAVHKVGWSRCAPGLAQLMFLVGDSPPHDDYQNEPDCLTSSAEALQQGIIVNAIECGNAEDTKLIWQQIARRGQGQFMAIAQDGGIHEISTPYDKDLSVLGRTIGGTYVAYGGSNSGVGRGGGTTYRSAMTRSKAGFEDGLVGAAPAAALADRAYNKAINGEAYDGDLLLDVENGKVQIDKLAKDDLPDDLQKLNPETLKTEVLHRIMERKALKQKIMDLSRKREDYITEARRKTSGADADGFDAVVTAAIKTEAATKGVAL